MINLIAGLPETITVDGRPYIINTDFRVWLNFDKLLSNFEQFYVKDWLSLFIEDAPELTDTALNAVIEFYVCKDKYPVSSGGGAQTVSYEDDMGYIYADFLRQYRIDLLTEKMHWWSFVALFRGLTTDMQTIISYRSYKGKDSEMVKAQTQWRIQENKPQTEFERQIEEALDAGEDIDKILKKFNGG